MKVSVCPYSIPFAPIGPENPLPKFRDAQRDREIRHDGTLRPEDERLLGYETGFKVLPDLMQDGYARERKVTEMKSIVLENETLAARFLPDYGGRLVSLFDKRRNREILYRNPVFQPANLAIRNAWFSGGIEWNIGQFGHSTHTCSPLFFAVLTDDEGNEFLRAWEYNRLRKVFWQIDFHLPSGTRELGVYVRIVNDNRETVPMYWWTNTAVREDESCRVFSGTDQVIYVKPESVNSQGAFYGFGLGRLPELDSLSDRDASYPLNFDYSSEYFFQTPETDSHPWEAVGWKDGSLFYERSTHMLRYRKLFCWGNLDGGQHWRDSLALPGQGAYVELQAGLAPTQVHGIKMPAETAWEFTQLIGAGRMTQEDLRGEWSEAQSRVKEEVDRLLPGKVVDQKHQQFSRFAERPPGRIVHTGTGWGALERRRREKDEGDAFIPLGMAFPDDSLTEDQRPWLNLLESGCFQYPAELGRITWMCDQVWEPHLERTASADPENPWPLIHMGVMKTEAGAREKAMKLWQQSISRKPTALAWRNIAKLLNEWGETSQAVEALRRSLNFADDSTMRYISEELMEALVFDKRYKEAWEHYKNLPAAIRDHENHVRLAAVAAFHLNQEDFLQTAFNREYAMIREGDRLLVNLWYEYRKSKEKHGVDSNEIPPRTIDFRMV